MVHLLPYLSCASVWGGGGENEAGKLIIHTIRFGRDTFQESMKIVHRTENNTVDWNSFRFMVFDIPTSKGNYQERYQQLRTVSIQIPTIPSRLRIPNLLMLS